MADEYGTRADESGTVSSAEVRIPLKGMELYHVPLTRTSELYITPLPVPDSVVVQGGDVGYDTSPEATIATGLPRVSLGELEHQFEVLQNTMYQSFVEGDAVKGEEFLRKALMQIGVAAQDNTRPINLLDILSESSYVNSILGGPVDSLARSLLDLHDLARDTTDVYARAFAHKLPEYVGKDAKTPLSPGDLVALTDQLKKDYGWLIVENATLEDTPAAIEAYCARIDQIVQQLRPVNSRDVFLDVTQLQIRNRTIAELSADREVRINNLRQEMGRLTQTGKQNVERLTRTRLPTLPSLVVGAFLALGIGSIAYKQGSSDGANQQYKADRTALQENVTALQNDIIVRNNELSDLRQRVVVAEAKQPTPMTEYQQSIVDMLEKRIANKDPLRIMDVLGATIGFRDTQKDVLGHPFCLDEDQVVGMLATELSAETALALGNELTKPAGVLSDALCDPHRMQILERLKY